MKWDCGISNPCRQIWEAKHEDQELLEQTILWITEQDMRPHMYTHGRDMGHLKAFHFYIQRFKFSGKNK